jgi:hypothetical protein
MPSRKTPFAATHGRQGFRAFARCTGRAAQRLTQALRDGMAPIFREDEIIIEASQRAA